VFPSIKLVYSTKLFTLDALKFAAEATQHRKAAGVDELVNEILELSEFRPVLLDIINQSYVTKCPTRSGSEATF
jgi:hypothetical protein